MADVYSYLIQSGVITTDTDVILQQVQDEYKAVFGTDLNVDANTPQGMLINAEALARTAVADNNATLANQINPNIAGGVYLDAIMALTGSFRKAATSSTVTCTVTGVPGTIIPSGSLASEIVNGAQFEAAITTTIPVGGTVSMLFISVEPGAIPAAANTLTQIVSNILGWETITNPADATLGTPEESDVAARARRLTELGAQGDSLAGAIIAAVSAVDNVKSMIFQENVADTTQTINGVSMVSHSLYMCIDGGTDLAVATAIANKKSGGCSYNNGASGSPVSQAVTMQYSGQVMNVLFDRPDLVGVLVKVTASVGTSALGDPTAAIKQAVLDYAAGLVNNDGGLGVGRSVSPFEIAGAINIEVPGVFVHKVELSAQSPISYSTNEFAISVWQKSNIPATNITVVIT